MKDYISEVKMELDSFTSCGIPFLISDDSSVVDNGNGTHTATWTVTFNGEQFKGVGANKKAAKHQAYMFLYNKFFNS